MRAAVRSSGKMVDCMQYFRRLSTVPIELNSLLAGATIQNVSTHKLEAVMSDRDGNSFVWFVAGLGLGALLGVLYAPRSGAETRDVLRSRAEDGREYVRSRAREAKDQASEWADRGRDVVNQQKDQFRAAYEAGRQAYNEATTEVGAPKNL
jgi:gas vesicle protein